MSRASKRSSKSAAWSATGAAAFKNGSGQRRGSDVIFDDSSHRCVEEEASSGPSQSLTRLIPTGRVGFETRPRCATRGRGGPKKRKAGEMTTTLDEDTSHCPVCMDWYRGEIYQCKEGHLVCGSCKSDLSACPTCRAPMQSIRARAVESILKSVVMPSQPSRRSNSLTTLILQNAVTNIMCTCRAL